VTAIIASPGATSRVMPPRLCTPVSITARTSQNPLHPKFAEHSFYEVG
jgi:hypothetical protein